MLNKAYLLNWLTLILILSGCGITPMVVQEVNLVSYDTGGVESVYFCPRDNCSLALEQFVLSAEKSVHCAIYDLDLENVIGALDEQSKKIDVKLIVDTDNFEYVEHLDFVKQDNRSSIMHNKFCIVDGKRVSSGSTNPTINGVTKNNNNFITLYSKILAENYEDEFQEMWSGTFSKGNGGGDTVDKPVIYLNETKVENYFCPEDDCGEKIEQALKKAKKSIHFMTFSFTHTGIANELVMKLNQSVEIKGIFEKRGAGSQYSRFKLLDFQGANVRKDTNGGAMHHKVFIIDNSTVITGSFNPSKNADTRNDENVLIIHDKEVASKYLEEFDYIWHNVSS